jgi:tetratricopeptide (TPR) repeat protein
MKNILFALSCLLLFSVTCAASVATVNKMKRDADVAYSKNNYSVAIQLYENILKEGESAEVYYNLGNSYYKHNEIAKSILNYERALLLEPYNDDVRNNLEIARGKTIDKSNPSSEFFFVTWAKALGNQQSADGWSKIGILFFILFLGAVYFYVFSKYLKIKKIGFAAGLIFLGFTIIANIFAFNQKNDLVNRNTAIVMSHSVILRSTPSDSGTKLFEIHDGHKVSIKDNSMSSWKNVQLEDGKEGWVHTSDIAII